MTKLDGGLSRVGEVSWNIQRKKTEKASASGEGEEGPELRSASALDPFLKFSQ